MQLRAVPPLCSQGPGSVSPSRGLESGVSFWHIVGALQLWWGAASPSGALSWPFSFCVHMLYILKQMCAGCFLLRNWMACRDGGGTCTGLTLDNSELLHLFPWCFTCWVTSASLARTADCCWMLVFLLLNSHLCGWAFFVYSSMCYMHGFVTTTRTVPSFKSWLMIHLSHPSSQQPLICSPFLYFSFGKDVISVKAQSRSYLEANFFTQYNAFEIHLSCYELDNWFLLIAK